MDRKISLSSLVATNTSFGEDIKSIIYYLASQRDKSEWFLDNPRKDNPWDLSLDSIIPLIRRTPAMSALGKWIYPVTQSIQGSFFGLDYPSLDIESSTKKEDIVDTMSQKSIGRPQILKASLSKREIILQSLRPLSGRKTVLDKLRSRLDKLKTNIRLEKHQVLGQK